MWAGACRCFRDLGFVPLSSCWPGTAVVHPCLPAPRGCCLVPAVCWCAAPFGGCVESSISLQQASHRVEASMMAIAYNSPRSYFGAGTNGEQRRRKMEWTTKYGIFWHLPEMHTNSFRAASTTACTCCRVAISARLQPSIHPLGTFFGSVSSGVLLATYIPACDTTMARPAPVSFARKNACVHSRGKRVPHGAHPIGESTNLARCSLSLSLSLV